MAEGGDRGLDLQNLSTVVTLLAGIVSAFYVVGLVILGFRLQQYGFPVETVISQLPQTFLAVVGLTEVGMPVAVVALIYLAVRLLTQPGRAKSREDSLLHHHVLAVAFVEVLLVVAVAWGFLALERQQGLIGQQWDTAHLALAAGAGVLGIVMGWVALVLGHYQAEHSEDAADRVTGAANHSHDLAGRAEDVVNQPARPANRRHLSFPGHITDPASRSNAMHATLSACLAVIPLFVFNGVTLPLPDVKLCPITSAGKGISGWLIGTTVIASTSAPRRSRVTLKLLPRAASRS